MAESLTSDKVREVFDISGIDRLRSIYLGSNWLDAERLAWLDCRADSVAVRPDYFKSLTGVDWADEGEGTTISSPEGFLYLAPRIGHLVTISFFEALPNSKIVSGVRVVNEDFMEKKQLEKRLLIERLRAQGLC